MLFQKCNRPAVISLRAQVAGLACLMAALTVVANRAPTLAGHSLQKAQPPKQDARSDAIIFHPHRAVYEVTLGRVSAGSTIASLEGRMVYELSGNPCDGYTQNLRFVTRTTNQNGDAQLNDLRTKSWESPAADRLQFDIENYRDDKLAEASNGTAERDKAAPGVRVALTKPEVKSVTLDKKALFPIAHSRAVLRAALAGETIFPAVFYDGSETGEKVYQTSAVIGKRVAGAAVQGYKRDATPLDLAQKSDSWPVAMSYYDPKRAGGDGRPSFEMSYRFHLNGVTSKFMIDHGDFAFQGRLSQLVFTGPAGCEAGKAALP